MVNSPLVCGSTHPEAEVLHGALGYAQGYTPAMLVHESRILQVTLFETLTDNVNALGFRLPLTDVVTIADEVDAQLTQTVATFIKLMNAAKPTELVAV